MRDERRLLVPSCLRQRRHAYPIDIHVLRIKIPRHARPGCGPYPYPQLSSMGSDMLCCRSDVFAVNIPVDLPMAIRTVTPVPTEDVKLTVKGVDGRRRT